MMLNDVPFWIYHLLIILNLCLFSLVFPDTACCVFVHTRVPVQFIND